MSQFLKVQFELRQRRNPQYSLRSFARAIGIAPGRLSEYFSGKRAITEVAAEKIASRLKLSESDRNHFIGEVKTPYQSYRLSMDEFSLISDWYHFAILSLIKTKDFRSDPNWIAVRLGIEPKTSREALARLERVGLIAKNNEGEFYRAKGQVSTTQDIPSSALRMSHYQSILRSLEALDEVPVPLRDITSITMPANPEKIGEVKKAIAAFRKRISKTLQDGPLEEVYELNIQLVPVTKN